LKETINQNQINKPMEKSNSIQNLTQGLAKFHAMVGRISKDAKNPFFKSNYASLPHIITEISEPMEKAGLVISQFPDGDGLTTMLIHAETGEYLSATYTLQVVRQNDPQAQGSALSYARRYGLTSVLNLAISDDDAEAAMRPVRQAKANQLPDNWPLPPVKLAPNEAQFAGIVQYLNGTPEQQKTAKEALKKYSLTKDQLEIIEGL
jgi:hypothetical protein